MIEGGSSLSNNYFDLRNTTLNTTINNYLSGKPKFIKEYCKYLASFSSPSTILSYLTDITDLLTFIDPNCEYLNITPSQILSSYKLFLEELKLKDYKKMSVRRKIASINSLLSFLSFGHSPILLPKLSKHATASLSYSDFLKLITGMKKNDKKLVWSDTERGKVFGVIDIDLKTKLKRERFLSRNLCIVGLLYDTGMKVSSLVSADLSNLNLDNAKITVETPSRDYVTYSFSDQTASFLHNYLSDKEIPKLTADQDDFVRTYCCYVKFKERAMQKYKDEELVGKMMDNARILRTSGRSFLNISGNHSALFLSSVGKRLSVRGVEMMVKEMVQTYLPDMKNNYNFSPEWFRR